MSGGGWGGREGGVKEAGIFFKFSRPLAPQLAALQFSSADAAWLERKQGQRRVQGNNWSTGTDIFHYLSGYVLLGKELGGVSEGGV